MPKSSAQQWQEDILRRFNDRKTPGPTHRLATKLLGAEGCTVHAHWQRRFQMEICAVEFEDVDVGLYGDPRDHAVDRLSLPIR